MKTYAYKIQISGRLFQKLKLTKIAYLTEQQAIDVLKKALTNAGIHFTLQEEEDRIVFIDNYCTELASITET